MMVRLYGRAFAAFVAVLPAIGVTLTTNHFADAATGFAPSRACSGGYKTPSDISVPFNGLVKACYRVFRDGSIGQQLKNTSKLVVEATAVNDRQGLAYFPSRTTDAAEAFFVNDSPIGSYQSVDLPPGAAVIGPAKIDLAVLPGSTLKFEAVKSLEKAAGSLLTPEEIRDSQTILGCVNGVATLAQENPEERLPSVLVDAFSAGTQCAAAGEVVDRITDSDGAVDEESIAKEFKESVKGTFVDDAIDTLGRLAGELHR